MVTTENQRIKIVFATCHPSSKGGISTWVRLLQAHIAEDKRLEAEYIYPAYAGEKEVNAAQRSSFQRIFGGIVLMQQRLKEFKRLLNQEKPNVLHLTTSGSLALVRDIRFLKMAKQHHAATVYHLHFGRTPMCAKNHSMEWRLLRKAIELADYTIAIDHPTEKILKKYFPIDRILYIPNPFDCSSLREVDLKQEKRIVFIGWCVKTKGVEELLEAWQSLCEDYSEYRLQLAGPIEETYRHKLQATYIMRNVDILGECSHEEAMRILGNAQIFILPSYTEGFPNVILEAMALGKPIIATNVGAIPDILQGCGIVIPRQNVEAIRQKLEELIVDGEQRRRLGAAAREKLKREYAFSIVFEQYIHVWNMACGR